MLQLTTAIRFQRISPRLTSATTRTLIPIPDGAVAFRRYANGVRAIHKLSVFSPTPLALWLNENDSLQAA